MPPLSPAYGISLIKPWGRLQDACGQTDALTVCQACDRGVVFFWILIR